MPFAHAILESPIGLTTCLNWSGQSPGSTGMPAKTIHKKSSAPAKSSVCEDVIERIKELIREGRFGPGLKIPSERELAEQLQVSRASIREALRTLAIMGVLETRHGSGTQVS